MRVDEHAPTGLKSKTLYLKNKTCDILNMQHMSYVLLLRHDVLNLIHDQHVTHTQYLKIKTLCINNHVII